jgi:hypothetical protein
VYQIKLYGAFGETQCFWAGRSLVVALNLAARYLAVGWVGYRVRKV